MAVLCISGVIVTTLLLVGGYLWLCFSKPDLLAIPQSELTFEQAQAIRKEFGMEPFKPLS